MRFRHFQRSSFVAALATPLWLSDRREALARMSELVQDFKPCEPLREIAERGRGTDIPEPWHEGEYDA
jgi:hypothetical protein